MRPVKYSSRAASMLRPQRMTPVAGWAANDSVVRSPCRTIESETTRPSVSVARWVHEPAPAGPGFVSAGGNAVRPCAVSTKSPSTESARGAPTVASRREAVSTRVAPAGGCSRACAAINATLRPVASNPATERRRARRSMGTLLSVEELVEHRLSGHALRLAGDDGHLGVAQGRVFAGQADVLLQLGHSVDPDDGGADGQGQGVVHGLAHAQGAGTPGDHGAALPGALLSLLGRRDAARPDAAAARELHADDAHLLLHGQGDQLLREAVVEFVRGVHRQQHRVEGITANGLDQAIGTEMARDAQVLHESLFPGLDEGLHGAALGEDLIDVAHGAQVVELPAVQVIRVEQFQGLLQHAKGAVPGALLGLAGEEGLLPPPLHDPVSYTHLRAH